jgi:hypothetical protein
VEDFLKQAWILLSCGPVKAFGRGFELPIFRYEAEELQRLKRARRITLRNAENR